jgi:Fe-S-cluster containining protein
MEDQQLVLSGQIPAVHLFTIRKGEWVRDNIKNVLCQTPAEIIKIKGHKDHWACTFLDSDHLNCTIYDRRPLECRMLQCWDTDPLQKIYENGRLSRRDLFISTKGIWDLITSHQLECDYERIQRLADRIRGDNSAAALEQLDYILRYDANIRILASEKAQVDPGLCDLLFGRPVSVTLKMFGLKVASIQGINRITATDKPTA